MASAGAAGGSSFHGHHVHVPFDKLEGVSNYNIWKFNMRHTLIMDDLWCCIEPGSQPIDPAKDLRALARVSLAVKPTCVQYIRNVSTAKQAWDRLSAVFEDKGFGRRVTLLRQLHRASYSDFTNMNAYFEHVMTLVQQLSDIGRCIEDAEVAEIILSGLPQEYDIIVSSLEAVACTGTISSDLVRTRLLQEEERKRRTESRDDMALVSKQQQKTKKVPVCHFCHRPGHKKFECYKLKKQRKDNTGTALTAQCNGVFESRNWIVDSGASTHMCRDLQWFCKISKCDRTVQVANGSTLVSRLW